MSELFVEEPIEPVKELTRIKNILESIDFKDWKIRFSGFTGDPWFQWVWDDVDHIDGGKFKCKSRKWKLSMHMTDSEVVQTAFAAAKMAMEHEVREMFKFQGRPVMRPHFDVYELMELCDQNAVSKRRDPVTQAIADYAGEDLMPRRINASTNRP